MFSSTRGKKMFILLSICIIFFHLMFMAVSLLILKDLNVTTSLSLIIQNLFTIVFEVVLIILAYKGFEWAKWLITVFLFFMGFMSLVPYNNQTPTVPSIIIGICLILIGILFFFSPSIKLFLSSQRDKRTK